MYICINHVYIYIYHIVYIYIILYYVYIYREISISISPSSPKLRPPALLRSCRSVANSSWSAPVQWNCRASPVAPSPPLRQWTTYGKKHVLIQPSNHMENLLWTSQKDGHLREKPVPRPGSDSQFAIEICHWNSGFSHEWWLMWVYQWDHPQSPEGLQPSSPPRSAGCRDLKLQAG